MLRVALIGAALAAVAGAGVGAAVKPTLKVDAEPRAGQVLFIDDAPYVAPEPTPQPALRPATSFPLVPPFEPEAVVHVAELAPAPAYQPVYAEPSPAYGPEPAWARAVVERAEPQPADPAVVAAADHALDATEAPALDGAPAPADAVAAAPPPL